jgi:hypothetical protein
MVEDEVAKAILLTALPASIRARVEITVIGSSTALARQLAALSVRGSNRPTLAVFDGDQRSKQKDNLAHAKDMCEKPNEEFVDWFTKCVDYLPGDTWPEAWLVQRASEQIAALASAVTCDPDSLNDILEYGLQAGKHNEFYEISRQLGISREMCLQSVAMTVANNFAQEFTSLINHIEDLLAYSG